MAFSKNFCAFVRLELIPISNADVFLPCSVLQPNPNRIFNKETYFLNVFWFPISFQKMIIQFRNRNVWNDFLFLSSIATSFKWQSKCTSIYFLFLTAISEASRFYKLSFFFSRQILNFENYESTSFSNFKPFVMKAVLNINDTLQIEMEFEIAISRSECDLNIKM